MHVVWLLEISCKCDQSAYQQLNKQKNKHRDMKLNVCHPIHHKTHTPSSTWLLLAYLYQLGLPSSYLNGVCSCMQRAKVWSWCGGGRSKWFDGNLTLAVSTQVVHTCNTVQLLKTSKMHHQKSPTSMILHLRSLIYLSIN